MAVDDVELLVWGSLMVFVFVRVGMFASRTRAVVESYMFAFLCMVVSTLERFTGWMFVLQGKYRLNYYDDARCFCTMISSFFPSFY